MIYYNHVWQDLFPGTVNPNQAGEENTQKRLD